MELTDNKTNNAVNSPKPAAGYRRFYLPRLVTGATA